MSDKQITVHLTITVGCEGHPTVKVETSGGTSGAPSSPCAGGSGGSGSGTTGGGTGSSGAGSTPSGTAVAQRTVHIVGGIGGLAWFTLIWPAPEVIASYNVTYAYDGPTTAALVPGTGADHPLYARRIGSRSVWENVGKHGQPTVFVAGVNQTHVIGPDTTTVVGGPEVVAAGAAVQLGLAAAVPVISFHDGLRYGPAPGAPAAVAVTSVDAAIAAIKSVASISTATEQDLRPLAATLAAWGITTATPAALVTLANYLLFTANAFRLGLVSTVLMPAFNDDPHGAFAYGDTAPAARADALARVLDGFYAELAKHPEPKSKPGTPLSLADNVVMIVSGDTPKHSFNRNGWPDGTPGGSNVLYVRSNGYLKPGWFGAIRPTARVNFDPASGMASPSTATAASTTAAQLGILFAITRGDVAAVAKASTAPFAGVIASGTP